jgi:hypothetical protein
MIAPQVKMASTIRSLVGVAETLRSGLQHRDPETDEILVDIKNTELYLKVRHKKSSLSLYEPLANLSYIFIPDSRYEPLANLSYIFIPDSRYEPLTNLHIYPRFSL